MKSISTVDLSIIGEKGSVRLRLQRKAPVLPY